MEKDNKMEKRELTYQAVYKCRLCGETYLQKYFDEKEITEDLDITDLMLNRHKCDNNKYGIADFQGFIPVEEFEYMGMPFFASDGTLYNVCDCGSYRLLTKPVVENGYRCKKCGKNWKTKPTMSTFKQ